MVGGGAPAPRIDRLSVVPNLILPAIRPTTPSIFDPRKLVLDPSFRSVYEGQALFLFAELTLTKPPVLLASPERLKSGKSTTFFLAAHKISRIRKVVSDKSELHLDQPA